MKKVIAVLMVVMIVLCGCHRGTNDELSTSEEASVTTVESTSETTPSDNGELNEIEKAYDVTLVDDFKMSIDGGKEVTVKDILSYNKVIYSNKVNKNKEVDTSLIKSVADNGKSLWESTSVGNHVGSMKGLEQINGQSNELPLVGTVKTDCEVYTICELYRSRYPSEEDWLTDCYSCLKGVIKDTLSVDDECIGSYRQYVCLDNIYNSRGTDKYVDVVFDCIMNNSIMYGYALGNYNLVVEKRSGWDFQNKVQSDVLYIASIYTPDRSNSNMFRE